jgi:hypothetical protein
VTRRRKRRLKWLGTALCAITFLISWAWAFTPEAWHPHLEHFGLRWGFQVQRQALAVYSTKITSPPGKTLADFNEPEYIANHFSYGMPAVSNLRLRYGGDVWLFPVVEKGGAVGTLSGFWLITTFVYIPLVSIPLLVLLLGVPATALLWWLDRQRPGFCRECGYDLTGNVSGRCPECGTPTPDPSLS